MSKLSDDISQIKPNTTYKITFMRENRIIKVYRNENLIFRIPLTENRLKDYSQLNYLFFASNQRDAGEIVIEELVIEELK